MVSKGQLLIANPVVSDPATSKCVFFVVNQDNVNLTTICINRPYDNGASFSTVMSGMGLNSDYCDVPLYFGGIESTNRVFILHSMDWSGLSTIQLAEDIGFTTDLSILAAISENQGPEYFKPCAGFNRWNREQINRDVANSKWSVIDASAEMCFGVDDQHLWDAALNFATKEQVDQWF